MKIQRAVFSPGISAFFFDDQRAIREGAPHDGFTYLGDPVTPGFSRIRMAGEAVSIQLLLASGQWAVGDCAAVQYSGAGGRDPLFLAAEVIPFLERHLRQRLEGMELRSFRDDIAAFEELTCAGQRLHTAIRYGLSQALLHAHAIASGRMMAEVLAAEYGLPVPDRRVPVFGQSGDNRYDNVDKMILKRVDVLPHGLINNVADKLGHDGGKLREYLRWLVARIAALGDPGYRPAIHLDVYGTIGLICDHDPDRVAAYCASLEPDAGPHELYLEGPVDREAKEPQIAALRAIREGLERRGSRVKIVADEWCNTLADIRDFTAARACHMVQIKTPDLGGIQDTVAAVIHCHQHGMEAYQGGTCNETDVSARACVHAALATRADRLLAKPGMGFDEGFSIVNNEMERILAITRQRH